MRAEPAGIKANARDPSGNQTGVLPCCDAPASSTAAAEQEVARFSTGGADVVVDRLPSVLGDLESNRQAGLLLADRCTVDRISMRRYVLDLERDDIAPTQLAIDRQIEHRQIARTSLYLQLGADRPYVLRSQRGLGTDQLAFVPSNALRRGWDMILMVLHGGAPQLLGGPIMRRR